MSNHSKQRSNTDRNAEFVDNAFRFLKFMGSLIQELLNGIVELRPPLFITVGITIFLYISLARKLDYQWFGKGSSFEFIWTKPQLWNLYFYSMVGIPAFIWGTIRVMRKRQYKEEMDTMFKASGVTNRIGQTPKPVESFRTGDGSGVLRVSAKGISVDDFKKSKAALEQSLRAHIDGFETNLASGTIDIKYSQDPIPDGFPIGDQDLSILRPAEFIVGTKKTIVRATLDSVPHALVAGETGGGKSTFLRQLITGLYLNDSEINFLLIDLKGGLEFHTFRNLPRVSIHTDLDSAITGILTFEGELDRRFRLLESADCRDIESYNKKAPSQKLHRHLVIIDEVAELFLAHHSRSDNGIDKARGLLNRIARQGRSIGIHLVLATQRPDSRSLDSQIKANLTGVLCFAMVNDASSINVLGNGKATDLAPIKGRALWKVGSEITEVQTPYLSEQEASQLLAKHRRTAATMAAESDRFKPLK